MTGFCFKSRNAISVISCLSTAADFAFQISPSNTVTWKVYQTTPFLKLLMNQREQKTDPLIQEDNFRCTDTPSNQPGSEVLSGGDNQGFTVNVADIYRTAINCELEVYQGSGCSVCHCQTCTSPRWKQQNYFSSASSVLTGNLLPPSFSVDSS